MAIADDISVAINGDVRYTGTTANYTVIELHRFLQDLADDAVASPDDLLDITDDTPSDRSTDNIITLLSPYNIDDTLAQHLYDGSIIQLGGNTIYDGIVNFGVQGIHIEVMQNGGLITPNFWTTGLNADTNAGISHRFMVKTRDAAADIDGRRLLGLNREFGNSYGEFPINGTSRGNNVLALTDSNDLNNETVAGTVATWTSITNTTEGYAPIDVTGDGADEFYYSEWNKDTYTINQFYERMKWVARRGSAETIYGLTGDIFRGITHEIVIDTPTGTFSAFEAVSWTGGTGQMLAIDSVSAGTKMWIQLLTGVAPTDGLVITGGTSSATATVNVTVTERPISSPFVGASTGSAIIGAYGFGIESTDLTASDKVFDLDNTQRVPPNNVTFTVAGLVSLEDRVLVTNDAGSDIDVSQLTASGAYTGGEATFTVNEAIPSDTPAAGTIRVFDGSVYARVTYTGWSGSDFTGCTAVPAASDAANTFISYIDELATGSIIAATALVASTVYVIKTVGTTDFTAIGAASNTVGVIFTATGAGTGTGDAYEYSAVASFTVVYNSDRTLFIRVRDGGESPIKTFETTGTLGSSGGSTTTIRTPDE